MGTFTFAADGAPSSPQLTENEKVGFFDVAASSELSTVRNNGRASLWSSFIPDGLKSAIAAFRPTRRLALASPLEDEGAGRMTAAGSLAHRSRSISPSVRASRAPQSDLSRRSASSSPSPQSGRQRSPLMRDSRQLQHRNFSPPSERQSPSAFTFSNFAPGMQTAVAAFAIPRHHIAADNSVFTAYGRGTDSVAGSVAGSVASPVERGRPRLHSFDELPPSNFEAASPAASILSASDLQKRRRGKQELDNHPEEAGNDFAAAAAVGDVPDQVARANESAVGGPTSVKPKAGVARPVTKLQQAKRARFSHIRAMFACQHNDEESSEEEAGAVADKAGAVVNVSGLGLGAASSQAGEAGHAAASDPEAARRAGQMLVPPSHRPAIGAAAGNGTASGSPMPGQAPQPPTARPQPRQTFRISPIKPRGSAPPSTPSTAAVANSATRTAAAHASGNGPVSRHTSVAAAAETSRSPEAGAAGAAGNSGGAVAGFTLTTGRGALLRAPVASASGASAVDGDGDAEMITAALLEDEMMLVADRQQPLPLAITPVPAAAAAAPPQQRSVIASVANVALAALASIGISMIGNGEDDGKANTTAAGSAVAIGSAGRPRLTGASVGDDGGGEGGDNAQPRPRSNNDRSAGSVNTAARAGVTAAAADPNIVNISIRVGSAAAATTTSGASSAGSTGSSGGSTDSSIITIKARQTDSIPSIKHRLTHAYFPPQVLHHVLGYWGWDLRLAVPSSALTIGGAAAGAAGVSAGSISMQVMIGAAGAGSDSSTSSSSNSFSSIPDTMTVAGLIRSIEMAHAISGSPASAASCGAPSSPSPASASCLHRNPVTGQLHLDLTAELITLI